MPQAADGHGGRDDRTKDEYDPERGRCAHAQQHQHDTGEQAGEPLAGQRRRVPAEALLAGENAAEDVDGRRAPDGDDRGDHEWPRTGVDLLHEPR